MSKLSLTQVASAYESTQAINANYSLIEAAFENTLSLDGTAPNVMAANLDMNGYAILNASILNVENDSGVSVADGVSWAQEWAINAEDTPVSVAASGNGTTDFSSLHWAAKAATFNPALYATLIGATFTGQVKGITPVANEDLARKDYVDGKTDAGTYTAFDSDNVNVTATVIETR